MTTNLSIDTSRIRPGVPRRPRFAIVVVVVSVAAVLVSAIGSWIPSFWGDEAASVMSANRSVVSLAAMITHVDAVHAVYYLGLHVWVGIFGSSPFSVRLPSAFAIGVTVAAVMVIARRLGGTRIAIAAGIICAVLPRVTYMGSETRSYAFSAAIVAWLTVLLLVLLERRTASRRWWFAYGALLAFGTYVFLYVVLIIIAHALVLLSARVSRAFMLRWLKTIAIVVASASPIIVWGYVERGQISFLQRYDEVSGRKVTVDLWFGEPLFAIVAWTLILLALVAGILAWRSRSRLPRLPSEGWMPRLDVLAATWAFVPAVILISTDPIAHIYTPRYLSYCAPAVALLIAVGLDWAARRRAPLVAAGLVIITLCAVPVWFNQRQPYAKNESDFAQISEVIGAHAEPGDAIAFDETTRPSLRPRLAMHVYPADYTGLEDVTLKSPYRTSLSWYDRAYSIADAAALGRLDGVHRLWMVEYSVDGSTHTAGRDDLEHLGFTVTRQFATHRSVIYEYERPGA
ncbi:glycosyltransferase family 39 protein [Glaciihabitans sp. dw_435]|uniref:glycosyltransferase family 39 protein n=1 Tax=Glaciihabitans sp. dw_435 TaxID=2720081 RepID=UPI001BD6D1D4|nr:glycosyltransferase family 39 protein [Glaciihabitans sp. dw_435]